MAELTPLERLQPSLLDRLTDVEPGAKTESREQRVLNLRQLREAVRRDLSWLFNTTRLAATQNLDAYPMVARSVLNYGMPEIAGRALSGLTSVQLEHQLRDIVMAFEPRILPETVEVHLQVDQRQMNHRAVGFEIRAELWAQPLPQQLYLKTEIDLERGDVRIVDYDTR